MRNCVFFFFFFFFLIACNKNNFSYKKNFVLNARQGIKDRALCKCIVAGLDQTGNNEIIKRLIPYNPPMEVLYDSIIDVAIIPTLIKMTQDSIMKVNKSSPNAQGKFVYPHCMDFYRSEYLDSIVRNRISHLKKIKNMEKYILDRYPSF